MEVETTTTNGVKEVVKDVAGYVKCTKFHN